MYMLFDDERKGSCVVMYKDEKEKKVCKLLMNFLDSYK